MGKLTGLVMIAAGVGAAAYAYPLLSSPDTGERQLAEVVAIVTPGATQLNKPQPQISVQSTQAPKSAGPAPRIISAESASGKLVPTAPAAAPVAAVAAPPVVTVAPAGPSAIIAAPQAQPIVRPIEPPVPQLAKRNKADEDRQQLARDIQRELKRVGCLQSDADGNWNSSTRAAMKTFIDRVNATLPTDEPDHILKTLVQGHPGGACGMSCPSGQTASAEGRCLPTAVIAQAPAPSPAKRPEAARPTPSGTVSAQSEPMPSAKRTETASIPEPKRETSKAEPVKAAADPAPSAASSWQTSSTTAPPAMAAIAAAAIASTVDTKRAVELPGRMSVGATPAGQPEPPVTTFKPEGDTATPKIIVKPRVKPADSEKSEREKADKPDTEKPQRADKKPDRAEPTRPSVGAVAASESPRRAAPPPMPRVAAYRAPPPPPRYVGAYVPPSASAFRPRFGPQIFRQLETSGR